MALNFCCYSRRRVLHGHMLMLMLPTWRQTIAGSDGLLPKLCWVLASPYLAGPIHLAIHLAICLAAIHPSWADSTA
ncbi:hypothetical protein V8C37DRAFT_371724 [Trichoderma ceciliae]